jgi:hypothetical protein
MKMLFIGLLVLGFSVLATMQMSFSLQNDENAGSAVSRITNTDATMRQTAYKDVLTERAATIKSLLDIVNSPVEKNENFFGGDTPRNFAIALLGDMRAAEAVEALLEWIAPHEGQVCIIKFDIGEPFAVSALIKIGKPASLVCLKRLSLKNDDKLVALGKSKRDWLLKIVQSVEGNNVAKFMLQDAIDKEQDKDKKANLTAALALLDKWIKEEAERSKPPAKDEKPAPDKDAKP